MIRLKNIKKILARVILSTFLLSATVPAITSFAGDSMSESIESNTNDLLDAIKADDMYKQVDSDGSENTDSTTLKDELVEQLAWEFASINDSTDKQYITIMSGTVIIDRICSTAGNVPSTFNQKWKTHFIDTAGQLGIPNNSARDASADHLNDIKDSAKKIKLLQWGQGSDINNGAMKTMLMALDSKTKGFTDILVGYGLTMCLTFSCLTLSELVADRKFSQEAFGTTMLKMFLGLWIIYNYKAFIGLVVYWGGHMVESFAANLTSADYRYALYKNALASSLSQTVLELSPISDANSSIMTNIAVFGTYATKVLAGGVAAVGDSLKLTKLGDFLGNILGAGIIQLVSSFTIYSVIIEIMVRATFTPIAVADMYNDTLRSSAVRYLKKIAALALTGVVMYMILFAAGELKDHLPMWDATALTAINFTMLGLLARARSIAEDIIGAH